EADKVLFLIQQLLQPAAERVSAALFMEVAPSLVGLAVIRLDQPGQQLFQRLGITQFGIAQGQAGGLAVRLLVNLVNNTVVDGHTGIRSGRTETGLTNGSAAARYSSCRSVANRDGRVVGQVELPGADMKHMLMAALLGGSVSLATAEPLPAWHHPLPEPAAQAERVVQQLDTAAGRWLSADEVVERLARAEQVLVGEQHDNVDHHRLQLWLLQQLQHQRPQASLLLEMLTPSQQPAVEALQQQPFQGEVTDPEQQLQWNPG